jgi:predicted flap endonuclease-1-like 5' DNA nuclease
MKVMIVKAGPYNDRRNVAHQCVPGDILETQDWYAKSLIDSGYADYLPATPPPDNPEPPEIAEVPAHVIAGSDPVFDENGAMPETDPDIDPWYTPSEAEAPKPYDFTKLPGIKPEIAEAIVNAGITDEAQLIAALEDGTLVNVPGIGIKKYQALKKYFHLYPE